MSQETDLGRMSERRLSDAEREASRWIARLEASDVTLEDHKRFRAWLDAASENRPAYQAVSSSYDKLDGLKLLSPKLSTTLPRRRLSRRTLVLGGGGAVAIGLVGATLWSFAPATSFAKTYETPIGGREDAALPDGTEIALNADTRLRAAYTEQARIVHLERGEALFTITSDPRPFEVRTPFGAIVAEGTVFVVKLRSASARVSILVGQVSGETPSGSGAKAAANQELILSSNGVAHHSLNAETAARRLAWREHMLAFDGETLADAALDVERQTHVRFRFAHPAIGELRVGGYIDARDARAFASLVEANLGLSVRRQDDGAFLIGD